MICHLHRGQMSQYHLQLVTSSKTKMTKDVFRKPSYKPEIKNIVVHFMFFPKPHWCNKQTRNNKWTMKNKNVCVCACVRVCVLLIKAHSHLCIFCLTFNKRTSMPVLFHFLSLSFPFPYFSKHLSICSALTLIVLISFSVISCTDCTFTVLYAYEM